MRYFRYDGTKIDISDLKKHYAELSAKAQAQWRWAKHLEKLGTCIFWLVLLATFIGFMLLMHLIVPKEVGVISTILRCLGYAAWTIIALILSVILGTVAATSFWGKRVTIEKDIRRQLLNQACQELRSFYGFQEPFLVTKCYHSSDQRFNRHDVCLFVVDGKLRITANLHYGFFNPARDLGCYEFDNSEISVCPDEYKSRAAVELQSGEMTFLLGQRAKIFIENMNR